MPAIKSYELKKMARSKGVEATTEHLTEAIREKHLAPEDFSIKGLFEALVVNGQGDQVGADVLAECFDPRGPKKSIHILEAAGAVSSTSFSNISGQIFYNK